MVRLKLCVDPRVLRRESLTEPGCDSSADVLAVEGGEMGLVDMLFLGLAGVFWGVTGLLAAICVLMLASKSWLAKGPLRKSSFGCGTVAPSDSMDGKGIREESVMSG